MGTEIRTFRPGDLEACRALWVELTGWHREIYRSPHIGGPDPGRQFDDHLRRVGPDRIWVAEVDGRIVGMTGLIPGDGEAELEPLVVTEALRGSGIGRRLVETVLEAARSSGVDTVSVRPVARNARAIRFFHDMGFDILGHIEMFIDFRPDPRPWGGGERLGGVDFRY